MQNKTIFRYSIILLIFVGIMMCLHGCSYVADSVSQSVKSDIERLEYKVDNMRYDYCNNVVDNNPIINEQKGKYHDR